MRLWMPCRSTGCMMRVIVVLVHEGGGTRAVPVPHGGTCGRARQPAARPTALACRIGAMHALGWCRAAMTEWGRHHHSAHRWRCR